MSYTQEKPMFRYLALVTFAVAAISDAVDGFVARAYDQKTKLGAVLDPLADKLLINITFVFLAVNHEFALEGSETSPIPAWFPVIILGRDVIIVLGSYLINEYVGPVRVRPKLSGKLTTFFQLSLIFAVLLQLELAAHLMLPTLIVSIISFFDYLYTGVRQVGNEDAV